MPPQKTIHRRTVVRELILGTAVTLLGGVLRPQSLSAVGTINVESLGTLKLKTGDFPALQSAGGSVRLNVGLEYPIVLSRAGAETFYAVSSKCQHNGCVVNAFAPALGLIRCSCHGSTYQIDGTLVGGPARRSLDTYAVQFDGIDTLSVQLPGITYAAREIALESTNGETRRFRIVFNPLPFTSYQVHFKTDLNTDPQLIPFSLLPMGDLSQTTYTNRDLANLTPEVTLYVEMRTPQGFFQIVQLVTEY